MKKIFTLLRGFLQGMSDRRLKTRVIIVGFLLTSALNSYALTPAQKLVEKMADSAKTLSYKGYFAYDRGQRSSSYYLVHMANQNADKQRLVFLDGEPLEIINDGHSYTCIHPGDIGIHSSHNGDVEPFFKLNKSLPSVWQHYNAEITNEGRIANRSVVRVELTPKDSHRYPFVFFIDEETGLMLKMLILDTMGRPLERFHYVMIDYENVSEADLKPGIKNYTSVNHSKTEQNMEVSATGLDWQLTWVPGGFQRDKAEVSGWIASNNKELSYMYSDGLSTFSVFVEQAMHPAKSGTSKRMGSTSAVSHYLSSGDKVFLVTVVGEIPLITAKQIAMSVRQAP